MPIVRYAKGHRDFFEVPPGANLMKSLLGNGVPVASSCLGDGVCGKCRIQIVTGAEHLSPQNDTEKFLREKLNIPQDQRISCQTQIFGDISVHASYW